MHVWLQHLLIGIVRLYRWLLSPVLTQLFNPNGLCRFNPSCSEYALQSLQIHGAFRGSWLAFKRILRCNPWGSFGFDPVPSKKNGQPHCGCGGDHAQHHQDKPVAVTAPVHGPAFAPRPTSS
ncbi:MAG TPA: membrane protein insertion efficiency factor YidD [Verrucomicrobiae bacterium]